MLSDKITLSSGSVGAKQEDIERVLEGHGYEPEDSEPEDAPEPEAPKPAAQQPPTNDQLTAWHRHNSRYNAAVQQFKKEVPDWDTVVSDLVDIPGAVYQAVVELELPELAYHLGRHLDFTAKLAKMEPAEAYAAIYKLAERFRPPEGVVFKGSTALRSGGRTEPTSKNRPAPKTAAAAAARGDYKAWKALQGQERHGGARLA